MKKDKNNTIKTDEKYKIDADEMLIYCYEFLTETMAQGESEEREDWKQWNNGRVSAINQIIEAIKRKKETGDFRFRWKYNLKETAKVQKENDDEKIH